MNKVDVTNDFKNIISNIKKDIDNTRVVSIQHVNRELIMLYFRIGKVLEENSKYGNKLIVTLSKEIRLDYPNISGFSERNLRSMKLFYNEYRDVQNWQQVVANLPWGHNILLIQKIKSINIRLFYAKSCIENSWSRSVLEFQIETKYHLRIGNSDNNFSITIRDNKSDLVNSIFKDPYIFDFLTLKKNYKERELEKEMINRLKDILTELGKGFSFVGNQYKISTNNNDYYIDLLFYHLELRCYIVVELKVEDFKPEFIGQLSFYVTAIDETIKKDTDNPTIGLLLCKGKDKLTTKWSLKGTSVPIGISSYELDKYISKDIIEKLPTEDEINMFIESIGDL